MTNGHIIEKLRGVGVAALVATSLSVAFVGTAGAQTPPAKPPANPPANPPASGEKPSTPAAPAAPADLDVSMSGHSKGVGDTEEGDRYDFDVRVVNDGPGTAKNVRLAVNPPDEFDDDDYSVVCDNSSAHNGIDCNLGDLKPGEDAIVEIRGKLGEDGEQTTRAVASSDSPDANLENNTARHKIDVPNNDENDDNGDNDNNDGND